MNDDKTPTDPAMPFVTCPACRGSKIDLLKRPCSWCDGEGAVTKARYEQFYGHKKT